MIGDWRFAVRAAGALAPLTICDCENEEKKAWNNSLV